MAEPARNADQILVHFYRATVGHADAWRQRMDATTNWAAATTAAMVSVSFSSQAPHFVLLLAIAFDVMFLLMESRRYQVYDLWRRRVQWLHRYFVAPALTGSVSEEEVIATQRAMQDLAQDLGRSIPHLSLRHAVGYRLQRNYGYLFGVAILAWFLKLGLHPTETVTTGELLDRARVGPLIGEGVLALVFSLATLAVVIALQAPSERMVSWTEAPSRWQRWRDRRRPAPRPSMKSDLPSAPMDV